MHGLSSFGAQVVKPKWSINQVKATSVEAAAYVFTLGNELTGIELGDDAL